MSKKDKNKILILIADDEANLLLLLKDNLEEYGFEVLTATNGEEAWMQCSEKPDVIILDVEMPKLNGWQVCEKVRQTSDMKQTPILILSAYAQPEDIKKGLALGANKYLTKPFKIKELIDQILLLAKKP